MTYQEMTDLIKRYRMLNRAYTLATAEGDIWCVFTGDFNAEKIQKALQEQLNYPVVNLENIEKDGTRFNVKFTAKRMNTTSAGLIDVDELSDTFYMQPVTIY